MNDVATSISMARRPAYTPIGYHITHIPDAVYPWWQGQIDIVRDMFDPGVMPIFRRMVYRSQAGATLTFIHHGVARWDRDAESNPDGEILRAPKPYGWTYGRANVVERWFEAPSVRGSIRQKNNLPKPFVAWGDWIERWMREVYWDATAAQMQRYSDEAADGRVEASRRDEDRETAAAEKDELAYQRRQYEQLSEEDVKCARGIAAGHIPRPDPKPFVHLKGA